MTKAEQRIKILEYLGWTNLKKINFGALRGTSPDGSKNVIAPNPLTNSNAMREALKQLPSDKLITYTRVLIQMAVDRGFHHLLATAEQQAEAYLKTRTQ
jgi:hypothetical protein